MDKQAELRAAEVQRIAEKKKEAKRKRDEVASLAKKASERCNAARVKVFLFCFQ